MEIVVVGKPAINIYMPLSDTLQEGDVFSIDSKVESAGNIAATCSCLFKKWKVNVHLSGITGNDGYAEKIRNVLGEYKVNLKYLETNYTLQTSTNFIITNSKTGISSKILYNDNSSVIQKYKYDFLPDFAILDGADVGSSLAFLNSYPSSQTVLYTNTLDKELIAISKRSTHVVSSQNFAEAVAKMKCDETVEGYIAMYQKIVDVTGKSNFIIILNNHKILYSIDGKVKMLPEAKMNIVDSSSFDSIFVGTFGYAISNGISVDDAVKLANTAASLSLSKIGEVEAIPEFDDVLDNSGLREKLGMQRQVANTTIEPMNNTLTSNNQAEVQNTNIQNQEVQTNTMVQNQLAPNNIEQPTVEPMQTTNVVNENIEAQPQNMEQQNVEPIPNVINANVEMQPQNIEQPSVDANIQNNETVNIDSNIQNNEPINNNEGSNV